MKRPKHITSVLFIIIALILVCLHGIYTYKTKYEETEIASYISADEKYELRISQVGTPEFPYGKGKCRLKLYSDNEEINRKDIEVYNDGKIPSEEDFKVLWHEDRVAVTVSGEEMEDLECELYYHAQ